MWLVKGAPDLMLRLPGLPTTPDFVLLDRREAQTVVLASSHTTFREQPYIQMVLHRPIETIHITRH